MTERVIPAHVFVYAGTQHNIYHANKGEGLPKHDHTFNHATICHSGSCVIRKEGKEMICNKDTGGIDLAANEWHEIEAIEYNTVFENIFYANENY